MLKVIQKGSEVKIFTLTLSICVLLILLSGCSGNSSITKHEKIRVLLDTDANNELDDQHAIAYMLLNGQVFEDVSVLVENDSLHISDEDSMNKQAFPISDVEHIVYRDRIIGVG